MASHTPLRPLRHARDTIDECLPGDEPYYELSSDKLDNKLHDAFSALVALVNADPRIELSCEEKGDVWYIILKLWVGPNHQPWITNGDCPSRQTKFIAAPKPHMTCLPSQKVCDQVVATENALVEACLTLLLPCRSGALTI